MQRFWPTDNWVRRIVVPVVVFMALASDRGYLADFWHHLARGQAMVVEGGLVNRDLFTFTVSGQPFQDVNWLSQLLYYGLYQLGGLGLVQVMNALVLAATFRLLVVLCHRVSGSLYWASLVGIGTFLGSWHVLTIRPQTFSLLLFVILFSFLEWGQQKFREGKKLGFLLWVPPLFLALWTNLHGAFPAGLMLVGCYFLAALWQSWRQGHRFGNAICWQLGACLFLCVLATLINPYGWGIYLYVENTSARSSVRGIDEWLPPTLDFWIGKAFVLSLLLTTVLLFLNWRKGYRPEPRHWILLGVFLALACTSARMVVWWLLVLAPLATGWLAALTPQTRDEPGPTWGASISVALLLLLAIFSLPGLDRYNPLLVLRQQPRVEEDLEALHVQVQKHLARGRIFTRLEWGEYLTWSYAPAFSVFMDGRIEIYPDDVWHQYTVVTCGLPGWQKILDDYAVDVLILDAEFHARTGFLAQVEQSTAWQGIFRSRDALLLVRKSDKHSN